MKQVNTMPASGNFVAVWSHGGQVWSTSFHVDAEGYYTAYSEETDKFYDHAPNEVFFSKHNAVFFVEECEHDYDVYPDGVENSKCFRCGEFK